LDEVVEVQHALSFIDRRDRRLLLKGRPLFTADQAIRLVRLSAKTFELLDALNNLLDAFATKKLPWDAGGLF
jgi:hypothetical protein